MVLQYEGKTISTQVQPINGVFNFNKDVAVKTNQQNLEISIYLMTGKGNSILAGVISASAQQLAGKQGEILILPLNKCIDKAAVCELKVNHVLFYQQKQQKIGAKSSAGGFMMRSNSPNSPQKRSRLRLSGNEYETRSQFQANILRGRNTTTQDTNLGDGKKQQYIPKFRFEKQDFESQRINGQYRSARTVVEGSYISKRKEHEKQRLNYKKVAQQTENNYKLDIMKYKTRVQELDKAASEKAKIIKQLKDQILEFQRKNIEKSFMEEELSSKQKAIKILDQRICSLSRENATLRASIAENLKIINQLKQNARFDLLKNKQEFENKQERIRCQLKECKNRASGLELELGLKNEQILKIKKYIEELESNAEKKIFEHDGIMQELRQQGNHQLKIANCKIAELEAESMRTRQELVNKDTQIQQFSQEIMKLQQSNRHKQQSNQQLQQQKNTLERFKADFSNLSKKYAKLEEQLKQEQKAAKKNSQAKDKQYQNLQGETAKNIKLLQVKLGKEAEKCKQMKNKIVQLENTVGQAKEEEEKYRQIISKLQKSTRDWQSKYSTLEKQQKGFENKLQNQEKQLYEKKSSLQHRQSLYKLQLEHSKQLHQNLTRQCQQISAKYLATNQLLETLKNQKAKLENKHQLLEENVTRLNQYIKQRNEQNEGKKAELRQQLKNANSNIKRLEEIQNKKEQEINGWKIKQLNDQNKIERLQKNLEESHLKIEKLENSIVPKIQEEKQKVQKELDIVKVKLQESLQEMNSITNERSKLQCETDKNLQINSLLNEEKIKAVHQINKTQELLVEKQKSEQKLHQQLAVANQQIQKLNAKIQGMQRQNHKNNKIIDAAVENIMSLKKTNNKIFSEIFDSKDTKNMATKNLARSSVVSSKSIQVAPKVQSDFGAKTSMIQSAFKQQQNTIVMLQDNLIHYRLQTQKLQRQLGESCMALKLKQQKFDHQTNQMFAQLDRAHQKSIMASNQYEDKLSRQETELNKKEKDLKLQKQIITSLRHQIEMQRKKIDMILDENDRKQHRFAEKIQQTNNQLSFYEISIQNLESDKKKLQARVHELEGQYNQERSESLKKSKSLQEIMTKYNMLESEHEQALKVKKQQLQKLLAVADQFGAMKENVEKTRGNLQQQQSNSRKLQQFSNELLKQKQTFVKERLELSAKVDELEEQITQLKSKIHSQNQLTIQKDEQISSFKKLIQNLQKDSKKLVNDVKEQKNKISALNIKIQEQSINITQKQAQLHSVKTQSEKQVKGIKHELKIAMQQIDKIKQQSIVAVQRYDTQIFEKQQHNSELRSQINALQTEMQQKEQQIFFEKQKNSLNHCKINEMKKQIQQLTLEVGSCHQQINQLNQEVTCKEQGLYEYSDTIFSLQRQLEATKAEMEMRVQKIDINWQCRHDQICEEYQQKIQFLQKDKQFLKEKLGQTQSQHSKLLELKTQQRDQLEKDIGTYKNRERQMEAQKLQVINNKQKQLDRCKAQITALENQLTKAQLQSKNKQNQVSLKQTAIKKLESKIVGNEQMVAQRLHALEVQIEQLKKVQTGFKNYKQQMRNTQWVIQRQSKKIIQIFVQRILNYCPQTKQKLSQPIRAFQSSIANTINFKV